MRKWTDKLRCSISMLMCFILMMTLLNGISVKAEYPEELYPYTLFASSDKDGAITANADNFSINGNIATNGTIAVNGNMNINGTRTEHADEDMIYIFQKIDDAYFTTSNIDEHTDDYILEETNINIDMPTAIEGKTTLTGNININSALKSLESIILCGEVKNTDNSVIFSESGDIIIDSENVNLSGLIYVPYGKVEITAKNLNLNNIVIIAQSIIINAPSINANYGKSAARLVGTASDGSHPDQENPEKGDSNEENDYEIDENENGIPDFFEEYSNWKKTEDADGDEIPDALEDVIRTDKTLWDTDGDGLNDCYEIFFTLTDPMVYDSVKNGSSDGEQDFDEDGLTNIQEYEHGTLTYDADTDKDGLTDGDEIYIYGTEPLLADSDEDGLEDSDEKYFGTDPVDSDSDDNGILDGGEKRSQKYIYENEGGVIRNVSVSMEATGNLQKTMQIDNVLGKDYMCSEVAGLFGEPFSFETDSEFDKATITFEIDQAQLDDTALSGLLFLWYDNENGKYVELETVIDEEAGTISTETTHFSSYMLVDKQVWYEARNFKIDYGLVQKQTRGYIIDVAIDLSSPKNMNRGFIPDKNTDPDMIKKSLKENPPYDPMVLDICEAFIDNMDTENEWSYLFLDYYTESYRHGRQFGYDMQQDARNFLKEIDSACFYAAQKGDPSYVDGYSDFSWQLQDFDITYKSFPADLYEKSFLLVSSGNGKLPNSRVMEFLKKDGVKVDTVAVGEYAEIVPLRYISNYTGGKCYVITSEDELNEFLDVYFTESSAHDLTDFDHDGIPDIVETKGIVIDSNHIFYTDPYDEDSDDDGLLDGEEIVATLYEKKPDGAKAPEEDGVIYYDFDFVMKSDPTNEDTDGDGLLDGKPVEYNNISIAPTDPDPIVATGMPGLWNQHIVEIENDVRTAYDYSDEYYRMTEYEGEWKFGEKLPYYDNNIIEVLVSALSAGGSYLLDFRYDDEYIAVHSDTSQWQVMGGYNDFYDWVFDKATSMNKMKLNFTMKDGQEYVIWAWKGNYINLGAGTEVGFYKKNNQLSSAGVEHWDVAHELPMTLSLYRKSGASYTSYYHWLPYEEQWWITGFVPDIYYTGVTEDQLVHVSSVDFSSNPLMMDALKERWEKDDRSKFLIFDKSDYKLWIMW